METKMCGKAWVFGDFLDVDHEICNAAEVRALKEKATPITKESLAPFCMTVVDPEFPDKAGKGDILVAGENMGYGHDHYEGCLSILGCGIAAVLCDSAAAYFFRNALENGLPVVECPGIRSATEQGDDMEIDLEAGSIKNLTQNTDFRFIPYSGVLLNFVRQGGLYEALRQEKKE